jgi:uncharacterized integral membrane protein
MGRIVFSIVSLIVLTIVIVMNIGTVTSFNLFGWQFEDVPVIVIAIVAFVTGAVYSFIFYITSYFARSRREKLAMQKQRLKSQEQQIKDKDATLKAREKQVEAVASSGQQRALPPGTGRAGSAGADPFGARKVGSASTSGSREAGGSGRRRTSSRATGGFWSKLFGRKTSSAK